MFPLLFEQIADSILITDATGTIEYVNGAFEELTGYSRDEAIGKTPSILKSGLHPREVFEELWMTIRAGNPFRFIFTNRRQDGELYEEGVMISPLKNPEGEITHYLAMGRVIHAFRQSYDVFTLLANSAPAAIYLQRDGKIFFVNDHLTRTLGHSPEELIGREWLDLVVEEDRERVVECVDAMLAGRTAPFEYRVRTRDGSVRWLMSNVNRVAFRGLQAVAGDFVTAYVFDITERKDTEQRLSNALAMYAATIESTTDGIIVVDLKGRQLSRNRRFAEIWNIPADDETPVDDPATLQGMLDQMQEPAALRRMIDQARSDLSKGFTSSVELKDGRHLEVFSLPQIVDGELAGRVWSWRDITEHRQFEATLLKLAHYDGLTGLMSRRKIQEEIERTLFAHPNSHGALLMLDLDGFKEVNDTFGHQAGDQVLIQVARALRDSGFGDLLGRFGGDEFAIFLPDVEPAAAAEVAARAVRTISRRAYRAGKSEVPLTASLGIAYYPNHATTSDELLSAADLAMYEAKAYGRNRVQTFSPRLRALSRRQYRGEWEAQAREAAKHRRGRLYVEESIALKHDLPSIYHLSIRMTGGKGRTLSSSDLGSWANQGALALSLDRWLLEEAVEIGRNLASRGVGAGLAFQLSAQSLRDPDILELLLELGVTRLEADGPLVLEIAHAGAVSIPRQAIRTLRSAGYRFKVPEVNSEKLQRMLETLPVDYLEIEPALVSAAAAHPRARALLAGLVQLAEAIGACTMARGARNEATLQVLRELGVDFVSGSQVGRARPATTLFEASQRNRRAA